MAETLEDRVYNLSEKLGATQGQVNSLFTLLTDLKESMSSIAVDIKGIKGELHSINDLRPRILALEEECKIAKKKLEENVLWRTWIAGAAAVLGAIFGLFMTLLPKILSMVAP